MKEPSVTRVGVVDALTSGLVGAIRRPWLLLIPFLIDLGLWLAPRLTVGTLMNRAVTLWEALIRASYSQQQVEALGGLLDSVPATVQQLGAQVNLTTMVTGSWLASPSLIAAVNGSRLTFLSDLVLAPLGLAFSMPSVARSPWQSQIDVASFGGVLLVMLALWLVGQVLMVLFFREVATGRARPSAEGAEVPSRWGGARGFVSLAWRLSLFSLLLWLGVWLVRLPLGVMGTLLLLSGSSLAGGLFALVGGITLWLLVWLLISFYFVGEGVVLDGQSLWRAILQSLALVRFNGLASIGLALIINLILVGFRVVWGQLGQHAIGAVIGMLGNAYLVTAMVLAVFAYYDSLRVRWLIAAKEAAARVRSTRG